MKLKPPVGFSPRRFFLNLFALSHAVKQPESQLPFDDVKKSSSEVGAFHQLFSAQLDDATNSQAVKYQFSSPQETPLCFEEVGINAGAFGVDEAQLEKLKEKEIQKESTSTLQENDYTGKQVQEDEQNTLLKTSESQDKLQNKKTEIANSNDNKNLKKEDVKQGASVKKRLSNRIEAFFAIQQDKIKEPDTLLVKSKSLKTTLVNLDSATDKKNSATLVVNFTDPKLTSKNESLPLEQIQNSKNKNIKIETKENNTSSPQEKVAVLKVKNQNTFEHQQTNISLKQDGALAFLKEIEPQHFTPVVESSKISAYLKESGVDSIVNQAKIILHNAKNGEINLVLRPENLGTVKIKLSLEDNGLSGKILVENTAVKEAFKGVLDDLLQTFIANGFDNANLDVFINNRQENSFTSFDFEKENATKTNGSEKETETINVVKNHYYKTNHSGVLNLVG